MLMVLTGRLPRVADAVEYSGWRFEIVDMDGKKIDKVLASRTAPDNSIPPPAMTE
jgi:putative hemolysin